MSHSPPAAEVAATPGRIAKTPFFVALAIVLIGAWSLFTIRFQTELWPLFPADLPSVRALALAQNVLPTGRELLLVPVSAEGRPLPKEEASRLLQAAHAALLDWPEVTAVHFLDRRDQPLAPDQLAAWVVANLPREKFLHIAAELSDEGIKRRLAAAMDEYGGAVDMQRMAMLRFDPLQLAGELGGEMPAAPPPEMDGKPGASSPSAMSAPPALAVRAARPLETFDQCQAFVKAVRERLVAKLPPADAAHLLFTGRPAFVAEISAQMKRDMEIMITLAIGLVCVVFWVFYRSFAPLGWILALLGLSMLSGVIGARLIFGELNVLSMAFASIILGVGMDYCILVYHLHALRLRTPETWRTLRRAIWLSAVTTAASFGILYFSSFPGFRQLAVLIAVGLLTVAYFATTCLGDILPRRELRAPAWIDATSARLGRALYAHRRAWRIGFALVFAAFLLSWPAWRHYSFYDAALDKIQPSGNQAAIAQRVLAESTGADGAGSAPPTMVILRGPTWSDVKAQARALFQERSLPPPPLLALLPGDEAMSPDELRAAWTPGRAGVFEQARDAVGFGPQFGETTGKALRQLDQWALGQSNFQEVRDVLMDFSAMRGTEKLLLLSVPGSPTNSVDAKGNQPVAATGTTQAVSNTPSGQQEILIVDWNALKLDLSNVAVADVRTLSGWMLAGMVLLCYIAHRSWRLVFLNMVALVAALTLLAALLVVTRTSLSLMSLLTVPLLVGLTIDYSLHFLLELEHSRGDVAEAYRHLALPVLMTGLASLIGFGAPIASQQPALQNFGFVMDLGVAAAVVTALCLLPVCYFPGRTETRPHYSRALYRAVWFDVAARIASWLGPRVVRNLGGFAGRAYAWTHGEAVERVRRNQSLLTPGATLASAARTYVHFGQALGEYFLLATRPRAEVLARITERLGYDHLKAAHEAGQGALLVTGHLGLFEVGGLLMQEFGFPTVALTLPEPSAELTRWRADYRKRWGVETLEVGDDEFAFVRIVRELRAGKFVAVLLDRPQNEGRVTIDLPGGRADFSTGPAMLAALSGSPLIPTITATNPDGTHRVEAFAPIHVPAGAVRDPLALAEATRQVAAVLVPALARYADQWYQFVPLTGGPVAAPELHARMVEPPAASVEKK